jgi:hypothetical protein
MNSFLILYKVAKLLAFLRRGLQRTESFGRLLVVLTMFMEIEISYAPALQSASMRQ